MIQIGTPEEKTQAQRNDGATAMGSLIQSRSPFPRPHHGWLPGQLRQLLTDVGVVESLHDSDFSEQLDKARKEKQTVVRGGGFGDPPPPGPVKSEFYPNCASLGLTFCRLLGFSWVLSMILMAT